MGNLLNFVSFCDKNTGVCVICGAGYNPENTITRFWVGGGGMMANPSRTLTLFQT